jgi:riboflavin kinase/FMN adenylyltransferase
MPTLAAQVAQLDVFTDITKPCQEEIIESFMILLDKKIFPEKTAVALGMFDGVHIGHRAVFGRTRSFEKDNIKAAVFTFDTESIRCKHGKAYRYILTNAEKLRMINEAGIQHVYCADFSGLCSLSAEDFVKKILIDSMNAAVVVCGPDYRFGKGAVCGVNELKNFGRKYGFELSIVNPVVMDNETVSSSAVRELLAEGNIKKANLFLGYNYTVKSVVCHGNHIGRTIDFPTVNQEFGEGQLIPARGVYASYVTIDGTRYCSVTNIGVKPTVGGCAVPLAETHIIGYSGDLYGRSLEIVLSDRIREEKKFGSLDELREQIKKDTQTALGGIKIG